MSSGRAPDRRLIARVALIAMVATELFAGGWAAVAPRSFFRSFPGGGLQWVVTDGPFNEHLVRDFGSLNLALALVLAVAAWRATAESMRIAAGAALVYGVPHLAYHLAHSDRMGGGADQTTSLAGLALSVVLPVLVLWCSARIDVSRDDRSDRAPTTKP